MNKETIFSIGLILLGFVFECIYLTSTNIFIDVKSWLLGALCIILGMLGVWIFGVLPHVNNEEWPNEKHKRSLRGNWRSDT